MHTSPVADILGRNKCFGLDASLNATHVKWTRFSRCIYNRSSIISSYDLPLTTNIKIPQVCHNGFRKYLITSHVSQADQGYECVMSREELGGLVMHIFSQESRCRVASDGKELLWKKGLRTLNIISFSLSCVNSETHNLQRVFLRIYDQKGKSLCQAFPAETVEIGNKN